MLRTAATSLLLLYCLATPVNSYSAQRFLQRGRVDGNVSEDLTKQHLAQRLDHTAQGEASTNAFAVSKQAIVPVMPIEDQLMGMTEPMKQAMYDEMTFHGSAISQAINFVRSHPNDGWAWCANDGQTCACNGKARFGSHAAGWPTFTMPIAVAQAIQCTGANFQSTLPSRVGLHCQCLDASEATWQNAKLHYNSVSYFQEAWIMLTRVLAQAKLLPMNGDRHWQGEQLFSARGGGSHDRTFMNIFLGEAAQYIPSTPATCIEWAPTMYMSQFPACAHGHQYSLDYEPDINKMHIDATGVVHCDNVHLTHCLGNTRIDVALSTNVWEHEIEPFKAMQSLYDAMNPGGVMLFTVPFVAPFHGVPYDFYRYTKSGVVHLLERAGFCVPRSRMAGGGDFINDVAMMAGVGPGDFSQTEIQQSYFRGYDNIPDGSLVIMAVALKKVNTHDPCPA